MPLAGELTGSLYAKPAELKLCRELADRGYRSEFKVGSRVGRGFADLGCEEFLIIAPGKLVSLFTGQTSSMTPDQEHFFFHIPTVDQLVDLLSRSGTDVSSITHVDRRSWRMTIDPATRDAAGVMPATPEAHAIVLEAPTIFGVLLKGVLTCIESLPTKN